ncbi:hypothetical protein EG329_006459 [Mollisiaceae sp. DMI_Dod_QoI]|nr:hypothetical protein EG329_006459 [Helotiales sp. DMI_Dod_QoI]
MPLPPEVIKTILSSGMQSICDDFFRATYGWIPIISKKRIYRDLHTFDPATSSSLALLLLCMKLVTEVPLDGVDQSTTPLYLITQQFYSKVESTSQISLHALQSTILLAVFEIGHGILPTGYLRIGHAARLGALMGFHDRRNAAQLFKPSETWTLREEERRTWWAIVILDRYVHIGTSGVPLAAPDPGHGDLLPCSDQNWAEGDVGSNHPLFSSSFSSILDVGHFASTCQASHILGRVLNHRDDATNRLDRPFRLSQAMQLHQALVALDSDLSQRCFSSDFLQLNNDDSPAFVAFALCCSGRLILYNMYGCNEPDENLGQQSRLPEDTEMQQVALDGIREVILFRMSLLSQTLMMRTDLGSPLICYSLYHAASECAWFIKENQTDEIITMMKTYIDHLMAIEKRWKVAALYLRLLELEGITTNAL